MAFRFARHICVAQLCTLLFLFCLTLPAFAQQTGLGLWEDPKFKILRWVESQPDLQWYYNWRSDHLWHQGRHRRTVEFVPMIHSAKNISDKIKSRHKPRALLAFNEPDGHSGPHQSTLSVAEAVRLWPKLEARGLRLSSPATTMGGTLGAGSWQRRFMDAVETQGLRVDFMAVHYYSTDGNVETFRRWLKAVHREYKRPIWVTEFAFIDWRQPTRVSYQENARFARDAIAMMDQLPFVERHAWFAANPYPWRGTIPEINLLNDDLSLTQLGVSFFDTLRDRRARIAGLQK
ncbi:hypothetical protein GFB49_12775 [Epibacterium sp. SM1979]|uniref:Asl1-like glycosyl hydrolase catalytic domain-containing protein n=1 Tax=Tritonibacter litoralis TaxID=2662264 RepID=A0A843YJB6_9RHOB|nr:hypothetical protein [Tritonibacter litoralis]